MDIPAACWSPKQRLYVGGIDLVAEVLAEVALSLDGTGLPDDEGRDADERRQRPDGHDHHGHAQRRALGGVLERMRDDEVTVDADRAQVEDGRRTQHHVQRRPDVAQLLTERPLAVQLQRHARQ